MQSPLNFLKINKAWLLTHRGNPDFGFQFSGVHLRASGRLPPIQYLLQLVPDSIQMVRLWSSDLYP
jgi:hypothetical protein